MDLCKKFPLLMAMLSMLIIVPVQASEPVQSADDGSWVIVSGKVVSTDVGEFTLDYGKGRILVEMDGWSWYDQEQRKLLDGKRVIVQGRIDDTWLERRSIEAASVYVKGLNTYFYASSADEEGDARIGFNSFLAPYDDGKWISLSGTVSQVDGRVVVLKTELGKVRVDTSEMDYNPLDDKGYQRLKAGDQIVVNGPLNSRFKKDKRLTAENIVTMHGES